MTRSGRGSLDVTDTRQETGQRDRTIAERQDNRSFRRRVGEFQVLGAITLELFCDLELLVMKVGLCL